MKKVLWVCLIALLVLAGCSGAKAATQNVSTAPAVVSGSALPPFKVVKSDVPLKIVSMPAEAWPNDKFNIVVQTKPGIIVWAGGKGLNGTQTTSGDDGRATLGMEVQDHPDPGYIRLQIGAGLQTTPSPSFPNKIVFVSQSEITASFLIR
jgi:hypothetical protein